MTSIASRYRTLVAGRAELYRDSSRVAAAFDAASILYLAVGASTGVPFFKMMGVVFAAVDLGNGYLKGKQMQQNAVQGPKPPEPS